MQESNVDQQVTPQVAGAPDAAAPGTSAAPSVGVASDPAPTAPGTTATTIAAAPAASADSAPADLAADELAKKLMNGLGFCGHYMHFHGGGMSGRAPIICLIAKRGGEMSQQELGASFELKPGSLSEVLNKMEVAGLIERHRNPDDRRQLTVHLTEEGVEQARLEQEARIRFRSNAFTCLSREEQLQLLDMLKRIRTRWEELDA